MIYFPLEINTICTNEDFECTKFQGKCSHDGTDTFCKCEKDYKGPTCAGSVDFLKKNGVFRRCQSHRCAVSNTDDHWECFHTTKELNKLAFLKV